MGPVKSVELLVAANNALHREIAALRKSQEWQPIETAPRDGTEVIVLCRRKGVSLGWYFAPSSMSFGWLNQDGKSIKPTHWMPLPPPPQEVTNAESD